MMADVRPKLVRPVLAAVALLGWTALALRFCIPLAAGAAPLRTLIDFLGYFTILSNILAALVLTAWALRPDGGGWLRRPGLRAAALVYMTVVGLVYVTMLRGAWSPQGLAMVCEGIMHYVMPPLYALCWLAAAPKGVLSRRQTPWWLLFPAAYLLYSLARGAATGAYPYFFIDAGQIGYGGVLLSALILLGVFWGLGLLVVAADNAFARRITRSA
jgi:hypothetical protein